MIIYPAIDLRQGRCVRLTQGQADAETVFGQDPAEMARRWADLGAEWLHVVNLDGALGESGATNRQALVSILDAVDIPVQFGGGIRSLDDAADLVDLGVSRVILGTVAIRQPEVVQAAVLRLGGDKVIVGIDARDGRVAIEGWQETSSVLATDLGVQMRAMGVQRTVYTDISRDGMLTGVNVGATAEMARATGLKVIASGGVASLDDIRALVAYEEDGVEGAITGMALYRGAMDLGDALRIAKGA